MCAHSRDRIRDEEATKSVFAPLSKRPFLRRSVIQRERREREEGRKVMACNVTLCDCGLVLLRAVAWVAVRYARLARIVRCPGLFRA